MSCVCVIYARFLCHSNCASTKPRGGGVGESVRVSEHENNHITQLPAAVHTHKHTHIIRQVNLVTHTHTKSSRSSRSHKSRERTRAHAKCRVVRVCVCVLLEVVAPPRSRVLLLQMYNTHTHSIGNIMCNARECVRVHRRHLALAFIHVQPVRLVIYNSNCIRRSAKAI